MCVVPLWIFLYKSFGDRFMNVCLFSSCLKKIHKMIVAFTALLVVAFMVAPIAETTPIFFSYGDSCDECSDFDLLCRLTCECGDSESDEDEDKDKDKKTTTEGSKESTTEEMMPAEEDKDKDKEGDDKDKDADKDKDKDKDKEKEE